MHFRQMVLIFLKWFFTGHPKMHSAFRNFWKKNADHKRLSNDFLQSHGTRVKNKNITSLKMTPNLSSIKITIFMKSSLPERCLYELLEFIIIFCIIDKCKMHFEYLLFYLIFSLSMIILLHLKTRTAVL